MRTQLISEGRLERITLLCSIAPPEVTQTPLNDGILIGLIEAHGDCYLLLRIHVALVHRLLKRARRPLITTSAATVRVINDINDAKKLWLR